MRSLLTACLQQTVNLVLCFIELQALYDMGLRPETAFGCAFRFLFSPNDAVKEAFGTEFERLEDSHNDVLKIGVNIRLGDWVFDSKMDRSIANLSFLQGTFDCAHAIEAVRKMASTTKVSFVAQT
jgi:hypothetical protein